MNDMNWKTWLLVLVIGVGLMFEVFKHMPAGTPTNFFDKDGFSFGLATGKPYSVKLKPQHRHADNVAKSHPLPAVSAEQLKAFVAANASALPQQTDFEHKEKGGEGKGDVKPAKNPDDYEVFVDPKTGKKYRRKKKKPVEGKQEELAKKPAPKPEKKTDDDVPTTMQTALTTGAIAPVAATDKDAFVGLEEWMRRLLTRPDAKMTSLFIQQYQQNLVGADIFYKITQLMLADSRVDMKQLGALCAGMTPSLMSFQVLAGVQKVENSGTALRTSVDGFLNNYTTLSNLGYLQRVLSGNDSYSIVLAAHYVELAANRYLQQPADPATSGPKAQDVVALNGPKFQQFLTLLQPLTKSHDPNVNSQANQTYSLLQKLLGTMLPAPTAPPAATAAGVQQPASETLVTTTQGP